ncbi:MAG: CheR family methyltransferase [Myxococcota bacterium]
MLAPGLPPLGEVEFRALRRTVELLTGIAVGETKRPMIQSRLAPRLRARGVDFAGYCALLETPEGRRSETQALINAVTTNKTSFFREPHQFAALAREWIPSVVEKARREGRKRLRIWSAACSTGQEPWTLAMVLAEALPDLPSWDAKILASDIDTDVLARAARGVYDELELEGLDAQRRERHLERTPEGWRVKDGLRALVSFKRINFLDEAWPIKTRFDAVLCRNASIYFAPPLQRRLFGRLIELLEPRGWLLVGHAEVLRGFDSALESRPGGLYRRRADAVLPPTWSAPPLASPPPTASAPEPRAAPTDGSLPARVISVGELHATSRPTVIRTLLGSCVAACLFDPVARVGGMNHFLLPDGDGEVERSRFGVHAMETLINSMMQQGADRRRLEAQLYGGADVLGIGSRPTVGERNIAFARAFLERERIPLVASGLGGQRGREVRLESHTGRVVTRELGREQVDVEREATAARAPAPAGGDVELFIDPPEGGPP